MTLQSKERQSAGTIPDAIDENTQVLLVKRLLQRIDGVVKGLCEGSVAKKLPGVLQRASELSSDERRKLRDVTARYLVGMAKSFHKLSTANMKLAEEGFMTGEYDSVLAACTNPVLAGPSWPWVAKFVEEQRQAQTEADASKPAEQLQAESDELVGLATTHFNKLKQNV